MAHLQARCGIDTEPPEERRTVQGAGGAPQRLVVAAWSAVTEAAVKWAGDNPRQLSREQIVDRVRLEDAGRPTALRASISRPAVGEITDGTSR